MALSLMKSKAAVRRYNAGRLLCWFSSGIIFFVFCAINSEIQNLNVVCQHVRVLQCVTLCLSGRVFLNLKNMRIDTRDCHRNIVQLEFWLDHRNIDADLGLALVSL